MRPKLLVIVVILVSLAGTALADLDVAIPPGTPLEWRFELPFHIPEGHRGPIYTHTPAVREEPKKKDDDTPRGKTIVVSPEPKKTQDPPPVSRFGSFNPMGAARILTVDIVGHMPWTQWRKKDEVPGETSYPPRTRADLHWLTVSALLRPMLHPAKVSRAEVVSYLTLIGPAIHETLRVSQNMVPVADLIQHLDKTIPKVPDAAPPVAPLVANVSDPETRMLIGWASREIVAEHPYSYNPLYARRTLSLGAEAIPVLLACSGSEHPLLHENATGLLAAFDARDEAVLDRLRKAAIGRDAVARLRALEGLVRWRDPQTEEILLKALKGRDKYLQLYAVQALGRMGSSKAKPLIQALLSRDRGDKGERWMIAAAALARMPDTDGKSTRLLRLLAARCRQRSPALEVGPGNGADVPDAPGARAILLQEEATIALARLGDEESRRALIGLVDSAAGAGGRFTDPVLGTLEPFNQLLAIEAFAEMGDDGRARLRSVVDRSNDFLLRGYALSNLLRLGLDGDFILEVASEISFPSVLRVQAMEGLASRETSRDKAIEVAVSMVRGYVGEALGPEEEKKDGEQKTDGNEGAGSNEEEKGKEKEKETGKGKEKEPGPRARRHPDRAMSTELIPSYECLAALKLLGRHRPLGAPALLKVLAKAREQGDYERLEGSSRPGQTPGAGLVGQGGVHETTLRAFPALFETAVVELGRLADKEGSRKLMSILKDAAGPGRVEAALALGNHATRTAIDALIEALEDREPWVRYGAYRSLKKIAGEAHFADWLLGDTNDRRRDALGAWKEWRQTKGAQLPE